VSGSTIELATNKTQLQLFVVTLFLRVDIEHADIESVDIESVDIERYLLFSCGYLREYNPY
jgi:hypothetical protein